MKRKLDDSCQLANVIICSLGMERVSFLADVKMSFIVISMHYTSRKSFFPAYFP